eukprot:Gb_27799 [translate_table: standard]
MTEARKEHADVLFGIESKINSGKGHTDSICQLAIFTIHNKQGRQICKWAFKSPTGNKIINWETIWNNIKSEWDSMDTNLLHQWMSGSARVWREAPSPLFDGGFLWLSTLLRFSTFVSGGKCLAKHGGEKGSLSQRRSLLAYRLEEALFYSSLPVACSPGLPSQHISVGTEYAMVPFYWSLCRDLVVSCRFRSSGLLVTMGEVALSPPETAFCKRPTGFRLQDPLEASQVWGFRFGAHFYLHLLLVGVVGLGRGNRHSLKQLPGSMAVTVSALHSVDASS